MTIMIRMRTYPEGSRPHVYVFKNMKFEDNYPFGFDIMNPDKWRNFLQVFQTLNGKSLPHKNEGGDVIFYDVYMTKPKQGGGFHNISLFPGYDKDKERIPIKPFGRLDKSFKDILEEYNGSV
jgi:hypothetical protein